MKQFYSSIKRTLPPFLGSCYERRSQAAKEREPGYEVESFSDHMHIFLNIERYILASSAIARTW